MFFRQPRSRAIDKKTRPWNRTGYAISVALLICFPKVGAAADYNVGPNRQFGSIERVPWENLNPGDRVLIHWRPNPYQSKWVICRRGTAEQPIIIRGIASPQGQLPIIDGRNAITRPTLNYWNEDRGVVKIGGANVPADTMPAHIAIEHLEIRSARPPARPTDSPAVPASNLIKPTPQRSSSKKANTSPSAAASCATAATA